MTQTATGAAATGGAGGPGSRAKTVYYVFEDVSDNLTTWEFRGVQEAYNTDQARREFAGESGGCFVAVASSGWQPQLATVKTTVAWVAVEMPTDETAVALPGGEPETDDFFGSAA